MASHRSLVLGAVAAVVLIAATIHLVWQIRGPRGLAAPSQDWFYDLNTQQLFAAPLGTIPPVAAPSGPLPDGKPAGVRAYVYSCGACEPAALYVAYLETYTNEARARWMAAAQQGTSAADMPGDPNQPFELLAQPEDMSGILVRGPDDAEWVARASGAGEQCVSAGLASRCGAGLFPRRCYP
ncbi:hypothetical protein HQ590_00095 [bacterium]|nr:hypothetical protein [bacterium]